MNVDEAVLMDDVRDEMETMYTGTITNYNAMYVETILRSLIQVHDTHIVLLSLERVPY
jgi:hypothetical protein